MLKYSFLFLATLIIIAGCKKDPQIIHRVLDISAGDTSGPDIHYLKIDFSFNGWSINDYYLQIDKSNPADFHIYYYFTRPDPHDEEYGMSIDEISPDHAAYLYLDKSGYPVALNKGDKISDTLRWVNNVKDRVLYNVYLNQIPGQTSYSYGNWINHPNSYLAFKIVDKISKTTYKGWIRVEDSYIKDCAYVEYYEQLPGIL